MRFPRKPTMGWARTGLLLATAAAVIPGCERLSPTEAAADTRVYGLDLQNTGGSPFVGEEIGVAPRPYTFRDLSRTSSDDQAPVAGVRIRWTVSPTSVLQLKGPSVTTTKAGLLGLDSSGVAKFVAVGTGEATITATIDDGVQSYVYSNTAPASERVRPVAPHTTTIKIRVVGRPARLELVPGTTRTRAGVTVPLVAKLYSAEGDQLGFGSLGPYQVVVRCLDPGVAGFTSFGSAPECAPSEGGERLIAALGPGTARFEATLVRGDPASTAAVPALRATTSVTFTKPFSRVVFEPPAVTARVQEEVALRYRLFDEDDNEVPGGDLDLSIASDPGGDQISPSLFIRKGTGNEFLLVPRTVLGKSEHIVTVRTGRREGAGPAGTLPFVSATATVRIVPRVAGFDRLPASITLVEGDNETLPFSPVYSFGAPTTPSTPLQYTTSNAGVATVSGSEAVGVGGVQSPSLTIRGVSAGPTGSATATVSVRTAPQEGPANQQIAVTVVRRTTLTSVTLASIPRNATAAVAIGATRSYELLDQSGIAIPAALVDFTVQNRQPAGGPAVATLSVPPGGGTTVVVLCAAPGTALVTGRPRNSTLSSSEEITCGVRSVRISAEPTDRQLQAGASFTYQAQVLESDGTTPVAGAAVRWTSANPAVATVDAATGRVTAVAAGTTGITAAVTGTTLTVTPAPAPTIVVTPSAVSVGVGQTIVLTANVVNGTPPLVVSFVSRNPAVASVDAAGSVRGVAAGRTWVVASYTQGAITVRDSADVTVSAPPSASRVRAILLEPRSAVITAPASQQYRVMFFDSLGARTTVEAGGVLQFTSSNPAVATVDPALGTAVGVGAGTTIIRARYVLNGQEIVSNSTDLTVNAPASGNFGSVTISTASNAREVRVGQELIFQVIVRDAAGNQITSGVTGLAVGPANSPYFDLVPESGAGTGYFFRIRGKAPTPLSVTDPLGGATLVTARATGAFTSIPIVVRP